MWKLTFFYVDITDQIWDNVNGIAHKTSHYYPSGICVMKCYFPESLLKDDSKLKIQLKCEQMKRRINGVTTSKAKATSFHLYFV